MVRDLVDKILKERSFCEIITSDLNLNVDLGLDSLNLVELIVKLEEQFDIVIDESDLNPSAFQTVGNVYSLVEKYMEE